ncbi:MAG: immunoglobulin domain-containing protein, partial [Ignavibacteriae bacterium]|nr:immunoglobulin domain-containing protein [Ignavibacteriota bacterium]
MNTFNNNVISMAMDRVNNPLNDAYPDNISVVDIQNIPGFTYLISPDPNGTPGDMNDQLHPNDKGYTKLANAWFDAIKNYLGVPAKITLQPQTVSAIEGNSVQFKVTVEGSQPISYQWKKNGNNIVGEINSTLILNNIPISENGSSYSCEVSNKTASLESDTAKLIVTNLNDRVDYGEIVHYDFNEGFDTKIHDTSIINDSLNLIINSENDVQWQPKSLDSFGASGINSQNPATKLFNYLTQSDEMTFEIWLKAKNSAAQNLSRIATYSNSQNDLNFSLLQNQYQYEFRLRTDQTDNSGKALLSNSLQSNLDKITHLVYTYDAEDTARLFVNGNLVSIIEIKGSFANWDSTYLFGIANEFNESLSWLGSYFLLGIYDRALSNSEISHNYSIGV